MGGVLFNGVQKFRETKTDIGELDELRKETV